MNLSRRNFLRAAAVLAPAVILTPGLLMRVKAPPPPIDLLAGRHTLMFLQRYQQNVFDSLMKDEIGAFNAYWTHSAGGRIHTLTAPLNEEMQRAWEACKR